MPPSIPPIMNVIKDAVFNSTNNVIIQSTPAIAIVFFGPNLSVIFPNTSAPIAAAIENRMYTPMNAFTVSPISALPYKYRNTITAFIAFTYMKVLIKNQTRLLWCLILDSVYLTSEKDFKMSSPILFFAGLSFITKKVISENPKKNTAVAGNIIFIPASVSHPK